MKFWVMSCVSLLLMTACEEPEDEIPKAVAVSLDGAMELSVMTFNIRYENQRDSGPRAWRERVVGIVKMLRRERIEVFGIQEGLHGQVADLRASLPDFDFIGVGRSDGEKRGEYAGIFYQSARFSADKSNQGTMWLSETPDKVASTSWGNEIPRVASWVRLRDRSSGQALWVINSHLDHKSQRSRNQSAKLIASKLVEMNQDDEPVIWLGDFNATEWNPVLRFIKGDLSVLGVVEGFGGLTETFDELHPSEKKRGTLHFWMSDPNRQWKVDHIFASKHAKILEADVIRSGEPYLSDHFPVKARVRFPKKLSEAGG